MLFSDFLDIFTAFMVLSILLIVTFSSFYDNQISNKSSNIRNHFKTKLKHKKHQILTIFSVKRNWEILSAPTKSDAKDLQFIECIRTFGLFGTVCSHVVMIGLMLPSSNPIFIDEVSLKHRK